ncbi:MAG: CHAT domain-containing protein [Gammaproteobacteria bacterium]|nr:CHAT domain-containing protein [Gammaproteobacteria bacterium]
MKPWWQDPQNGWPGKGVGDFFDASKACYLQGDLETAIEILQWGKRFSAEFGSGGAAPRFEEMLEKLEMARDGEAIVELLKDFVDIEKFDAAKDFVRTHPKLLSSAADKILAQYIEQYETAGDSETAEYLRISRQSLSAIRALLHFGERIEEANRLAQQFMNSGDASAIREAAAVWDEIFADPNLAGIDRDYLAVMLNESAACYMRYYQASGDVAVLEQALSVWQGIVWDDVDPELYAEFFPVFLNNAGTARLALFKRTGDRVYLDRACADIQSALEQAPESFAELPRLLTTQSDMLTARYKLDKAPQDARDAIAAQGKAVALTGKESPDYPKRLHQSAVVLLGCAMSPEDLEPAIAACRQAMDLMPEASPERLVTGSNLGAALSLRHACRQDPADLDQAIEAFQTSAGQSVLPAVALASAVNWLKHEFARKHWNSVTQAHACMLQAADSLQHTQLIRRHKEMWLRDTQGQALKAAYAFAKLEKPKQAAEALEQGQARLLSESLALNRADLSALQETENAHLYDAYQDTVRHWHWAQQHKPEALREIRKQLDGVIEQIRRLPGYAEFLMPSGWADIRAADTPLLYVSATEHGGLALLVQRDAEVQSIWLPDFSETVLHDILQNYLNTCRAWLSAEKKARRAAFDTWCNALDNTARRLWDCVFAPLRDSLPEEAVLIPAGLLNLLPLHAAWTPDSVAPGGRRYALDNWRIRYAPNARALKSAPPQEMPAGKLLAIDDPDNSANPRITPLANSAHEVRAVCAGFPDAEILSGPAATRAAVLEALPRCQMLHFSCHGHSDLEHPLRSSLLMANGEQLSLLDFLNTRLHARLAVLSACETGLPGTQLPDEAVSLAAGLLQAGVAGVVSSLWSVSDISTFLLMNHFYQCLGEISPAESLRRAQQWLRNSSNREILAEVREQVEAGNLDEAAYKQVRRAFGFDPPDERSFAHPFYWAAFSYVGV